MRVTLGGSLVREAAQQELNITERVAVYYTGDIDKVGGIDEPEEERRTWKAYHHSVRRYRTAMPKESL